MQPDPDPMKRKVTVEFDKVPIQQALRQITMLSGMQLQMPQSAPGNVVDYIEDEFTYEAVQRVLSHSEGVPLMYRVRDNVLVVEREPLVSMTVGEGAVLTDVLNGAFKGAGVSENYEFLVFAVWSGAMTQYRQQPFHQVLADILSKAEPPLEYERRGRTYFFKLAKPKSNPDDQNPEIVIAGETGRTRDEYIDTASNTRWVLTSSLLLQQDLQSGRTKHRKEILDGERIAVSPEARLVAIGSRGQIRFYDYQELTLVREFETRSSDTANVMFSKRGLYMAYWFAGQVHIVRTSAWDLVASKSVPVPQAAQGKAPTSRVWFDPRETTAIVQTEEEFSGIALPSGGPLWTVPGQGRQPYFSSDGRIMMLVSVVSAAGLVTAQAVSLESGLLLGDERRWRLDKTRLQSYTFECGNEGQLILLQHNPRPNFGHLALLPDGQSTKYTPPERAQPLEPRVVDLAPPLAVSQSVLQRQVPNEILVDGNTGIWLRYGPVMDRLDIMGLVDGRNYWSMGLPGSESDSRGRTRPIVRRSMKTAPFDLDYLGVLCAEDRLDGQGYTLYKVDKLTGHTSIHWRMTASAGSSFAFATLTDNGRYLIALERPQQVNPNRSVDPHWSVRVFDPKAKRPVDLIPLPPAPIVQGARENPYTWLASDAEAKTLVAACAGALAVVRRDSDTAAMVIPYDRASDFRPDWDPNRRQDPPQLTVTADGRYLIAARPNTHGSLADSLWRYDLSARREVDGFVATRTLSDAATGATFLVGRDRLVRIDRSGQRVAGAVPRNDRVKQLLLSGNQRYVVGLTEAGLVAIWSAENARLLATFMALEGGNHIVVTPDNYYAATRAAASNVRFRVADSFYSFDQFDLRYQRWDKVLERLGDTSTERYNVLKRMFEQRRQRLGFEPEPTESQQIRIPKVSIDQRNLERRVQDKNYTLLLRAWDRGKRSISRIDIFVNGVPAFGPRGLEVGSGRSFVKKEVSIVLGVGRNKIQISCRNDEGVSSLAEYVEVVLEATAKKPKLYAVLLGVSDYKVEPLKGRRDAEDLASLLERQVGTIFESVHIVKRVDRDVRNDTISEATAHLAQADVDDVVVAFFAGHGVRDATNEYYLCTADSDLARPGDTGAIPYTKFETIFNECPARQRVLFIDACNAGEAEGEMFAAIDPGLPQDRVDTALPTLDLMKLLLADLRRGSGTVVIAASGGRQRAGEYGENGRFTFTLLGALGGAADVDGNGLVTVSEVLRFVSREVTRLSKGMQRPVTREENLDNDFVLARTGQ